MKTRLDIVALFASVALAFGNMIGGAPDTVSGTARVIDGDTLEVAGTRVRLAGIDAPELQQRCRDGAPCGWQARQHLAGLILGHGGRVRCTIEGADIYGRSLAACRVGPHDLGEAMVRAGHAIPWEPRGRSRYEPLRRPVGFEEPAAWRRRVM